MYDYFYVYVYLVYFYVINFIFIFYINMFALKVGTTFSTNITNCKNKSEV